MFTEKTIQALGQVSQDIAADLGRASARIVAEVTIDANRLTTFGFPDADKEVSELVIKHGYDKVLRAAAKHVSVW